MNTQRRKLLIIEDEPRAANRLQRMILRVWPDADILAKIPSVQAAVQWFSTNPSPDLVFMDVRLEDGECFDILARVQVNTPIIFCTAYADYALRAFEAYSVDYLLKPLVYDRLVHALKKYQKFSNLPMPDQAWMENRRNLTSQNKTFKQRFLVTCGRRLVALHVQDILFAEAHLKGTRVTDQNSKEWILDQSLCKIATQLDPTIFFQISRQHLVRLNAISQICRRGRKFEIVLSGHSGPLPISRRRIAGLKSRVAAI